MGQIVAASLDDSFLNVDTAIRNFCDWVVLDKVVSHVLLFETDETEASRRPRVNIFQDNCIHYFSELVEVLFQLLIRQLKVESTHKDLRLGVAEFHSFFRFRVLNISCLSFVLLFANYVWIRLLNLLPRCCCDCLVSLVWLQTILCCGTLLVIVS